MAQTSLLTRRQAPGLTSSHRQAWFVEDDGYSNGGYWEVGHPNRPNDNKFL